MQVLLYFLPEQAAGIYGYQRKKKGLNQVFLSHVWQESAAMKTNLA
jgi:hypothetical protein